MRRTFSHLALLLVAPVALIACMGQTVEGQPIATVAPSESAGASLTLVPATSSPSPVASPTAPGELDLTREPFTVLLLGADAEGRTDTIMVVGIDIASRTMALASIPRDTIDVPLPGGGTFHAQKINAFWNYAKDHPSDYPEGPAAATTEMVGLLLGIDIDFYARTTFGGFIRLVDAMGGVSVDVQKAISDPAYQVTLTDIGIKFRAGRQTLAGDRALIYVRTRKADNDFERQRRQQHFVLAAGQQLLANPALLASLVEAQRNLATDFPVAQVPGLLLAIGDVSTWTIRQAVLGPDRYESAASCPCGYALAPKLAEFAKLGAIYFPWAVRT